MEKNFQINKIILLFILLFFIRIPTFSYDEILLYDFYNTDVKSNIEFFEDYKSFMCPSQGIGSYLELNYVFENYSQKFEDLSSYNNVSWKASRNIPDKINFILGNKNFGVNITMGNFLPSYSRELLYSDSDTKYELSDNSGNGIRYYKLFIYYSFGKFLNIGAGYGRVFGENKISETQIETKDNNSDTYFSYTNEHISGVYKYLYIEVIPVKFLRISGFFPRNITGSYTKEYYYKDNDVIKTDYSLYYAIPIMFGVKLDFKKLILFGNYRFTEKNIYTFDESSSYEFKGINNKKWNMYEIGGKILLNNPFIKMLKVSFEKGKYFILDKDSEAPKIYSLNGSGLITYKNIILKLSYKYLFSKTYFNFMDDNPLVKIKGSKIIVSLGFSL